MWLCPSPYSSGTTGIGQGRITIADLRKLERQNPPDAATVRRRFPCSHDWNILTGCGLGSPNSTLAKSNGENPRTEASASERGGFQAVLHGRIRVRNGDWAVIIV